MEPFQYNSINGDIDSRLAAILSNFETTSIISMIQESNQFKFRPYETPMPNIISAFENNFKLILNEFQGSQNTILEVRDATYVECINVICDLFGLDIIQIQYSYELASILYQLLLCDFTQNLISFFVNYINKEKDSLYMQLEHSVIKKKSTSKTYSHKVVIDSKLAAIHANIDIVLKNIAVQDISFENYLYYITSNECTNIVLQSVSDSTGMFFKDNIAKYIINDIRFIDIATLVKLQLQNYIQI